MSIVDPIWKKKNSQKNDVSGDRECPTQKIPKKSRVDRSLAPLYFFLG